MSAPVVFACHGCGATVDAARALPFRCPRAAEGDVDHVLEPVAPAGEAAGRPERSSAPNPFVRFRELLSPYRLARGAGLSDASFTELVTELDDAIAAVDGGGFRVTPLAEAKELASALGVSGSLWLKDETKNVAGSHKARHLMLVMLYLQVADAARLPIAEGLRRRRLAIASCGNAALAAAVVARAARWPLDVFIPPDAEQAVIARLRALDATITVCERRPGEGGDPCFLRFREAVAAGAIPFGVQGSENGLALEGGRTLALEIATQLGELGARPGVAFVQVGGGALASSVADGFALAERVGWLERAPRLVSVQTAGCAPLERAWRRLGDEELEGAARARSRYMWPWETTPASLAHGILDDETYDWWSIVRAMRRTGGAPVVVSEDQVALAHALVRRYTRVAASHTGTAGIAGIVASAPVSGDALAILSGVER